MAYSKCYAAMTKSPFTDKPQYLLVTGGTTLNGQISVAEILTDDGWEIFTPSLPVNIHMHCMVLLNSTAVMVIGGIQNYTNSAKTYVITDDKKVK
jgi:hypothetical protein